MQLRDFVLRYASDHPYGLRKSSLTQINCAVKSFSRWLGREAEMSDFNTDTINRWTDYLTQNRRPDTVRTTRGTILTLWRAAAASDLIPEPTKIRKLRKQKHNPQAWTASEIVDLVRSIDPPGLPPKARLHPRFPNGIPQRLWYSSLIQAAYDTGIRLGDLLQLSWRDLRFGKGAVEVRVVTSKTNDPIRRVLQPETVRALEDYRRAVAPSDSDKVWPLWGRREAFYRAIRKVVQRAGLTHGTFRYLRRAAVTQSDKLSFGSGQKLAGHRDARVTAESYRDQSQIGSDPVSAPNLWESAKREGRQEE